MRPKEDGIEDVFIGKISQTKANPDIHARSGGEVILNYVMGDEEKVSKAKLTLPNEAYNTACIAHQEGKTVKVTGQLVTYERTKLIENPTLEVI